MMMGTFFPPANIPILNCFSSFFPCSLLVWSSLRRGSRDLLGHLRLRVLEQMGLSNLLMNSITCSSASMGSRLCLLEGASTGQKPMFGCSLTLLRVESSTFSCWLMQEYRSSPLMKQASISFRSGLMTLSTPSSVTFSMYSCSLPVCDSRQSHSAPREQFLPDCLATHAVGCERGNLPSFSNTIMPSLSLACLLWEQAFLRSSRWSSLPSYRDISRLPIYQCRHRLLSRDHAYRKRWGQRVKREGPLGVFEYNSFMRGHQTYTLTSILNTDRIRPQLYQQILHGLKSPLEQVSIDITHDNSLEERVPRRPDIPPPPKSPLNQLAECSFSRTHESVSLSVGRSPQKEHFHDEVMQSVLSPLDQQISFKEEPRGMAVFCGGLIDSVLGEESNFEVQLPARARVYKRRPIFGGKSGSRPSKTVDQVIAILLEMGEGQMAAFFQLLRDLELELGRVSQERQGAKQYLQAILQRLSGGIELVFEQEGSMATYRVLRRLRSKNTYELVSKLVREDRPQRAFEANRRLESLMQSLGRLESIISRFMAREEAVDVLQAVYQSMQESFPSQPTLLGQIQRLGYSFGCSIDVSGLDFVWKEGNSRRVTRQEFIQGVSMNDCVLRVPRSFEEELQSKGFQRNQ